jgi:hypothetical protein
MSHWTAGDIRHAKEQTAQVHKRAKELERRGHVCVRIMETYPPKLMWCGKEPCAELRIRKEEGIK